MNVLIAIYILVGVCVWIWSTMHCHERWGADSLIDHVGFAYIGFCIGVAWPIFVPFLFIGMFAEWLTNRKNDT